MTSPPDRQVALQTVLDFIAEQQRYRTRRQTQDEEASSLVQLRHLADDCEDEDPQDDVEGAEDDIHRGFSTTWMPVRGQVFNKSQTKFFLSIFMMKLINSSFCHSFRPFWIHF